MECSIILCLMVVLGLTNFSIADEDDVIYMSRVVKDGRVTAVPEPPQTTVDTREYYRTATTPAVCDEQTEACGFQVYEKGTRRITERFVKYCECPEGQECRKHSDDLSSYFYRYKCAPIDSTETPSGTEATTLETEGTTSGTEAATVEKKVGYLHHPEDL